MDEGWKDISSEIWREYIYPDGSVLHVPNPEELLITESTQGGHAHRIKTFDFTAYYVRPGWLAVRWKVKQGKELFAF